MHFLERDLRTFSTEPFFRQGFDRQYKRYNVSLEESILASRLDVVIEQIKAGFAKVVYVLELTLIDRPCNKTHYILSEGF